MEIICSPILLHSQQNERDQGGDPAEKQAKVRTFSIGGSMKNKTLFIAPFLTDTQHHISVNSNPKTGYDGTP